MRGGDQAGTTGETPERSPIDTRLSAPITSDDHVQGPIDAAVTLVQYGDYECPYTRMSRHSVHQLQRKYPDRLRFVFRHFPLEAIHPHARAAAMAAEAAAHRRTSGQCTSISSSIRRRSQNLICAGTRSSCAWMQRSRVRQRVERDLASGEASGVQGTPTVYVNGIRHNGCYDVNSLRSAVVGHLRSGSAPACDSAIQNQPVRISTRSATCVHAHQRVARNVCAPAVGGSTCGCA